jgi:hypothetical protein
MQANSLGYRGVNLGSIVEFINKKETLAIAR